VTTISPFENAMDYSFDDTRRMIRGGERSRAMFAFDLLRDGLCRDSRESIPSARESDLPSSKQSHKEQKAPPGPLWAWCLNRAEMKRALELIVSTLPTTPISWM